MTTASQADAPARPYSRPTSPSLWRDLLIVIGLTASIQFALYWSSFVGNGVLLPLNILTRPGIYLPQHPANRPLPNYSRSDLVQVSEPHRWFMAAEYRAGRFPLWTPYAFAGTPLAKAPVFSPFELMYVLWPGPRVLPWIQLAVALVAATGAWRFASLVLDINSTSAITAGVAYPLTGFLTLWQGYDLSYPVACFPWEVLAALALVEKVTARRVVGLAVATALTLLSGPADIAGQVLLVTGCIWTWHVVAGWFRSRQMSSIVRPAIATAAGWFLGFLLAAPLLSPLLDYLQTSTRLAGRGEGQEVRPPVGWKAIPLVVFPEAYGTESDDSVFMLRESGVRLESAAGAYAGCLAMLFALPWAWLDRTRRGWVCCLALLAVLGLSWQLNLPGFVQVWRLPGLKMLSASRLVFASSWSILMLAVVGLEQFQTGSLRKKSWSLHLGVCTTIVCLVACAGGLSYWPEELRKIDSQGQPGLSITQLVRGFSASYRQQLGWLTATLILWAVILRGRTEYSRYGAILGALLVLELLTRAWHLHPQPDPTLYYPRLPALEFIQRSTPGRVLGVQCLPPKLLESHQLSDIRGYDGVDPLPMIELLSISYDRQRTTAVEYARSMWYFPVFEAPVEPTESFRLHPVLNMLGLRYVVFSEPVEMPHPAFQGGGYTVFVNQGALPRAWIPNRVTKLPSRKDVLSSMMPWSFAPATQAFVTELPAALPDNCSGTVELTSENPQEISLIAEMHTSGMVVIGDRYDAGWQATVDGQSVPLLCVNHALRGVVLSQGHHTIELRYRPAAFVRGVWLFIAAGLVLLALGAWSCKVFLTAFLHRFRGRTDREAADGTHKASHNSKLPVEKPGFLKKPGF